MIEKILVYLSNYIIIIITFLGSISICVGGFKILCLGFYKYTDSKIKYFLDIITTNRFTSFLSGLFTTCIMQSSIILTATAVSLLHAHLINLSQTLWIILGANIGTTFTAWIVYFIGFKFNLKLIIMISLSSSMIYLLINRKNKTYEIYEIIFGFSLLFLGLFFLKSIIPIDGIIDADKYIFQQFKDIGVISIGQWVWPLNVFIFIIIGALLSIIFQSSSVAMVLTIFACVSNLITITNAIAIIVGENLGATFTINIFALATNVDGKRAGVGHFLFNFIGFTWFIILYPFVIKGLDNLIPGGIDNVNDKAVIARSLAIFHTMFNVMNVIILYPFIPKFVKFLKSLFPNKQDKNNILDKYLFNNNNSNNLSTSFLPIISNEIIFNYLHLLRVNFNNIIKIISYQKTKYYDDFYHCQQEITKIKGRLILVCSSYNNGYISTVSINHYNNVIHLVKEFGFINEFFVLIEKSRENIIYDKDINFYKSRIYISFIKEINKLWNFIEYGIIKEKKEELNPKLIKIEINLRKIRQKLLNIKSPILSYPASNILISIDRIAEHLLRVMRIILTDDNIVDIKKVGAAGEN